MEKETNKSIALRTLERFPDSENTLLWIRININNPNISDETRQHLAALLKVYETLIPVGSVRIGRALRTEAREGKESIKILPTPERQKIIAQEEQKYYEKYSKS